MSAEFRTPVWQQVPSDEQIKFGEGSEAALRSHWGMRGFFLRGEMGFVPTKSIGTVEALHFGDSTNLSEDVSLGVTAGRFQLLAPLPMATLLGPTGILRAHAIDGASLFLDSRNFRVWSAVSEALPIGNEFFNSPGFTGVQRGNGATSAGLSYNSEVLSLGMAAGYEPHPYGSFLSAEGKPLLKSLDHSITVLEADVVISLFKDFKTGLFVQQQWDKNVTELPVQEDQYLFQKTVARSGLGLNWSVFKSGGFGVDLGWTGDYSTDATQVNTWQSSSDVSIGFGPLSLNAGALLENADKPRYTRKSGDNNSYYRQSIYKVELRVLIMEGSIEAL